MVSLLVVGIATLISFCAGTWFGFHFLRRAELWWSAKKQMWASLNGMMLGGAFVLVAAVLVIGVVSLGLV